MKVKLDYTQSCCDYWDSIGDVYHGIKFDDTLNQS